MQCIVSDMFLFFTSTCRGTHAAQWEPFHSGAVKKMRQAGLRHVIMVDAPDFGQDWRETMHETAPKVAAADSDGNTYFSVHMYAVYDTPDKVTAYFDRFKQTGLALLVGEFAMSHGALKFEMCSLVKSWNRCMRYTHALHFSHL